MLSQPGIDNKLIKKSLIDKLFMQIGFTEIN